MKTTFNEVRNCRGAIILWIPMLAIGCMIVLSAGWGEALAKEVFALKSAAFAAGGAIPIKFTCEGEDISPPLKWEGVPVNTRSLVLIVDDPDAPDPKDPKMTWVHWVVFNIPPAAAELPAGGASGSLPPGTEQGLNDWNKIGYGGPCPPIGRHRYFFKLYALNIVLKGQHPATKSQVEAAMKGHIIASAELVGTYAKSRK